MTAPVEAPAEAALDFSDHKGVWVYVQHRAGEAAPVSWQLLGVGRDMAQEINAPVSAVVLGSNVRHLADEAIAYGADNVYLVDDPALASYRTQPYAYAVAQLIQKYKPDIVQYASTMHGSNAAYTDDAVVKAALAADATQISVDPEQGYL